MRDVVKNDTFRTLATDTLFKGKVKDEMLVRLLEAFVWKNKDRSAFCSVTSPFLTLSVSQSLVEFLLNRSSGSFRDGLMSLVASEWDGLPFTYVQGD